jgi:hypothetical protein
MDSQKEFGRRKKEKNVDAVAGNFNLHFAVDV